VNSIFVKIDNGVISIEDGETPELEPALFNANAIGAAGARKYLDKLKGRCILFSSSVDFPTDYGGAKSITRILRSNLQ
jgi:hypothetical protein